MADKKTAPLRTAFIGFFQESRLLLAFLALAFCAIWALAPDSMGISLSNGRLTGAPIDILNRAVPVGLLALGMSMVIALRGVDLSVGAIMAIAGALFANFLSQNLGPLPAILLVLCAGIGLGMFNGFLVGVVRLQPIVATLILMVAGRGLAQLLTEGRILTFHDDVSAFLSRGEIFGWPTQIILLLLVFIGLLALVRRTNLGLFIAAIGSSPRAAWLAGLPVLGMTLFAYGASGLFSSIAGLLVAGDIQGADANNAGLWLELDAILAVVLGGGALEGGRFSLSRTLLAVVFVQTIKTGILRIGVPPEFNMLVMALMVALMIVAQKLAKSPKFAGFFAGLFAGKKQMGQKA